ncbi:MAG: 1-acyl-sn-glycerol-3-phosphate acyltransferase [Gemmatimonadaceae bacterium]|nr:1-acyl-sn-glycerol-3-phosphate acyltransferase [Acetobacteraceae bacterium]
MKLPTRRLRQPGLVVPQGTGPDRGFPRRRTRRLRAVRRAASIALWTIPAIAIQAVLLVLPGRAKVAFARFYWFSLCRLLGLHVRVIGTQAKRLDGRPVVFASNHSSWLDILTLGGVLEACFIAKEDVGRWPVISTIARLGRTVFVSRRATNTGRERDSMRERLDAGDNLVLFPEGTSSDGSRVLPFRSVFFSVVEPRGTGPQPLIQPVSVVFDQLSGLPMGRANRAVFAWYGDMDLASHFWRLAQHRGLRATVLLHAPVDPAAYVSRKELARAVWQTVADGAAALRQNRPVRPALHPALDGAPDGDSAPIRPAFA